LNPEAAAQKSKVATFLAPGTAIALIESQQEENSRGEETRSWFPIVL